MMKDGEHVTFYKTQTWLNDINSPSTGSVVCYHGLCKYSDEKDDWESIFLEISDCHSKSRLHRSNFDNKEDFIKKMELLRDDIDKFINHLKEN